MNTQEFRDFLVNNQGMSRAEIAKATGKSTRAVNEMQAKLRIEGLLPEERAGQGVKRAELTPEQQFALDMEKIRAKDKGHDKKYQVALKEINRLQGVLEDYEALDGTVATYEVLGKKGVKHESVAFAIASDWHVEENVKPESVDGTNKYNMAIAKKRAENFFVNTLKLVKKEQQDASIDTLVLAIIGDMISSNIHEELLESCEVPPVEAALFAQNLLASGIEYILKNSELKLIIPCCVGNHSRITHQVHVSSEQGNSLEWMIYNNLAKHFAGDKRVTFVLSKSYFTWVRVFGYDIRFHHGHAVKYGGGIGGLTVPFIKAIARYDVERKAYLDVVGHFHNRMDGGKFIVNGSLIGNTPYGMRLGFTGKPEQAFFLISKDHGKTIVAPIFVE